MATAKKVTKKPAAKAGAVSSPKKGAKPAQTFTFTVRIVFKSGAVEVISRQATSTNEPEIIRNAFRQFLQTGKLTDATYSLGEGGSFVIDWREVAQVRTLRT